MLAHATLVVTKHVVLSTNRNLRLAGRLQLKTIPSTLRVSGCVLEHWGLKVI